MAEQSAIHSYLTNVSLCSMDSAAIVLHFLAGDAHALSKSAVSQKLLCVGL